MGNEIYSSVFLVSEEFDLAWADNSLRQLKKKQRRIFGGTNLFAQGACFSAREKVEERRLKGYLFLGNDLVRYNIGMEMTISGSPAYYALIADFSADKVLARSILFSLDRAFNEFPVISFYTPAAFIDFGVFRYVPFGPYLLDFLFLFFPYGPLPFIGIISFRFSM